MFRRNPKASRILSSLNRHNLFTEVHPGEEPVYEFHPLFREFLLHRAEGVLSPEEVYAMRRRAAALLEDSGRTEAAVDLLRRCGDFRGVCRLIRNEAPSLARQGRIQTLGEWILSLPEDLRAEDPWLLYWSGVCSNERDPARAGPRSERALTSSAGRRRSRAFLSWSGIVDTILFEWNDFRPSTGGSTGSTAASPKSRLPSAEVEAPVSASMSGVLLRRGRTTRTSGHGWTARCRRPARRATGT
jgi:hypothetical protein